MSEEIESVKRELKEAIKKEFTRSELEVFGNIEDLLEKGDYIYIKVQLGEKISYQNISPEWLIKRIENGDTIEIILKIAKEAKARKERILQLIKMCAAVQSLDRK